MAESSTSEPGRWLSFRLRTLLAFTVFLAPILAWIAAERRQSAWEHVLANELNYGKPHAEEFWELSPDRHNFTFHGPWDNLTLPPNKQSWWRCFAAGVLGTRVTSVNMNFARAPVLLHYLRDFKSLEHLSLSHKITDISDLHGLHRLNFLRISDGKIKDLSPIASLTNLEYFGLIGVPVAELSPVAALAHFRGLRLEGTQIGDLAPFAQLDGLVDPVLTEPPVTDISPLKNLPRLVTLHLDGTPVRDLSPLAALPNLRQLSLEHTTIDDVSPLLGLKNLEMIWLEGATISDRNVSLLKSALPKCVIKQ
ncbi:MAG: leucine-rich repeat domain-containing protein [Pirellulales bacterium]